MQKNLLRPVLPCAYIVAMNIDLNNPQWLAVLMAYRNVTGAELARQTGVSERTIMLLRNGHSQGSLRIIMKLMAAMNCQVEARAAA